MELPERIEQKKAESDSYAILLDKLRGIGIFRNLTENDYGIDFEIEIVDESSVTGRYFKAQVKSAEQIYVREDGVPAKPISAAEGRGTHPSPSGHANECASPWHNMVLRTSPNSRPHIRC
jgi:hypothetical protein